MDAASPQDDLLLRLLSAATMRSRVIASNVANQNTPGYTRQELHFEELLRDAMGHGRGMDGIKPVVVQDVETPARQDGNNVNLEQELNTLRENRILYETYAAMLHGRGVLKQVALGSG